MSSVFGQENANPTEKHFGVAINSSILGEVGSVSFAPTATYYQNKHQFELGFAIHPFDMQFSRRLGADFSYKYFPNGIDNRFNLYFTTNLTLTNEYREYTNYYSGRYESNMNFVSLTGGYGFQVKLFGGAYIGTSLNLGVRTCSTKVTTGSNYNYSSPMFDEYYLDGALRLNIGYRF